MSATDPKKPKAAKRGPKPEHLIVPPEDVGAVLDRLMQPKKKPAPKPPPKKRKG